jgi:L-ribulose-5-phosphate 4-epimerase
MLQSLREEVLEANLEIVRRGLVLLTFGNASGIDRKSGRVVYETRASSDGVLQLTPALMTAMFQAAMTPFPGTDEKARSMSSIPSTSSALMTPARLATSWHRRRADGLWCPTKKWWSGWAARRFFWP